MTSSITTSSITTSSITTSSMMTLNIAVKNMPDVADKYARVFVLNEPFKSRTIIEATLNISGALLTNIRLG
jgi:hypothetical protein